MPMTEKRLDAARAALAAAGGDALVVYNADPHMSEYLPARWGAREWLSGFPGSAGTVAITADRAALFVDSRYLALAEAAMAGTPFEVHLVGPADPAPHLGWLVRHVPAGGTVLTDGMVLAVGEQRALKAKLAEAGMALRTDIDLFSGTWVDRPAVPSEPAWLHEPAEALVSSREKFARLREAMASAGATHHFVSALDDIAWLTNLRGRDIAHNPMFAAHLLVGPDDSILFALPRGFDGSAQAVLAGARVQLAAYDAALPALAALPADAVLLLDPRRVTHGFRTAVPAACRVIEAINPAALFKRIKTAGEIDGFRETMIEDGLALCRFQAAFEASRARGEPWTEWQVHEALTAERARSPLFRGLSFHTSAGFNANAALPHYSVARDTALPIVGDGLLLIDSGGQYERGTTDVCRVWAIGTPGAAMRRDGSAAMRGLIAMSRARFPAGIPGPMIDAIARAPLWAAGLNYFHGTGHGVGWHLGVHELPTLLSGRSVELGMEYLPGVVSAIEPGVYREGQWGVRHENIAVVVADGDLGFGPFARFETLTLCPFDRRCLDLTLLDEREIAWLDDYHAKVRAALAPRLDGEARAWLLRHTEPLKAHSPLG